jgi:hypothetical protein
VFVENVEAMEARRAAGEAVFCDGCMTLPEGIAEFLIRINDLGEWLYALCNELTGRGRTSPTGR